MELPKKDIRCDECDKFKIGNEIVICIDCVETICTDCDTRIHNRGMRIHHHRVPYHPNLYEDKTNPKFKISYFARQCYRNYVSTSRHDIHEEVRKHTFEKLFANTRRGSPMILLEELMQHLQSRLDYPPASILASLEKELSAGSFFHQTIRTFGDFEPLKYFSLCLNSVSLESIVWIIKSIKNDRMQPNETLIHSRFKECFAIKVLMKEWKNFIDSLINDPEMIQKLNRFKDILGEISIKKCEDGSSLFLIKDVDWPYEDLDAVDEAAENYKMFLTFIENFFEEKELNAGVKNNDSLDRNKTKQLKKWLSSVENSHIKTSSNTSESNLKKMLQKESIAKAIPGGKYGCALMLKNCGPEKLRQLSIGKISAFIKHALNKQIIIHHKTLIIKNDRKPNEDPDQKELLICEIKQNILNLLNENKEEGVTLAQLPLQLSRKYGKFYDFQMLGYPKLKNFLLTMIDSIELERSHNNHIKVRIKSKKTSSPRLDTFYNETSSQVVSPKEQTSSRKDSAMSEFNLNRPQNKALQFKGHSTLKSNPFERRCREINNYSWRNGQSHQKSVSDLNDYFDNISKIIIRTVDRNKFGIEIKKLEEEVSKSLKSPFDPRIFGAIDFEDFLVSKMDDYLELQIKKSIRGKTITPGSKNSQLVVYPKNYQAFNSPYMCQAFVPSKHDEYGLFNNIYDRDFTDNISEISQNNLNLGHYTQDSFSDTSFSKLQPIYSSSRETGSKSKPKKTEEDPKLYSGFEFAVVSPIYSLSNTLLNNEDDEDDDVDMNLDNKSLQFVNFLLTDKDA